MLRTEVGGESPTDVVDLTLQDGPADHAGLLESFAATLGSTLDLRDLLRRLADIGREATGARRASVFLIEGRRLRPAVSVSSEPDARLWAEFRGMEPIELDGSQWERLAAAAPVVLEDARESDGLVPVEWAERFSIGALVVVPLMARTELAGVLALDWPSPTRVLVDDLRLLEALATGAGLAIANARLYESLECRARLQEALVRAAAALSSVHQADDLAHRVGDAFADLTRAPMCAIGLVNADRTQITTLAVRGGRQLEGPLLVENIPQHILEHVSSQWEDGKHPIRIDSEPFLDGHLGGRAAGASWYLLLPLVVEEGVRGAVLLGFEAGRHLDAQEHSAAEALTSLAAAALERQILLDRLDRRYRQLDTLYRASAVLSEGADAATLVAVLNELLGDHGIEVRGLALRDRRLARQIGSAEPTRQERAAWQGGRWRAPTWVELPGGELAVPMRLGRDLVGALRVAARHFGAEERGFVEALGRGLAELADRSALRAAVESASIDRAVARERERMASDLHDTAGSALVSIGLLGRQHAEQLGAGSGARDVLLRLAALADQGRWEIDQALRALSFVPSTRSGLVPSVRSLARSFANDSGIVVEVTTSGRATRLESEIERALYRVVHEALTNAWRHAGCQTVRVELDFGGDGVSVRVTDDGEGLGDGPPEEGIGMAGMRRALREIGGRLRVTSADPRGTTVTATTWDPRRRP